MIKPAFLDLPGTAGYLSISEGTVKQLVRDDDGFPRPRVLSARRVGWRVPELDTWADSRPVSDFLPPANTGRKKATPADQQAA